MSSGSNYTNNSSTHLEESGLASTPSVRSTTRRGQKSDISRDSACSDTVLQ